MADLKVLIAGYRKNLARALERRKIPYAIWHHEPVNAKNLPHCLHIEVAPLTLNKQKTREAAARFLPYGPFTHTIAGTEAGVYPASVARRVLDARKSKNSVALRCRDKFLMKQFLQQFQIPMTPFIKGGPDLNPDEVMAALGSPVVIKERSRSGGRGMRLAHQAKDILPESTRGKILERFVAAPEISIESYINRSRILFENITVYHTKGFVNVVPGNVSDELRDQCLAMNRQVIESLGIVWGLTHLELYIRPEHVLFGEIALRPPGGYIMDCLEEAYDFDPWDGYVAVELDMPFQFPDHAARLAAVTMYHPGAGRLSQIEGLDLVRQHPCTRRLKFKREIGDWLAPRQGAGEDIGHVIQSGADTAELFDALEFLEKTIKIAVES